MSCHINRISELTDLLEKEGLVPVPAINSALDIKIYSDSKSGNFSVLIPAIIRRPQVELNTPEDFFKKLQEEIERHLHKIKKLIFQDGGTIPIPEWFIDWCRKNQMRISIVHDELLERLKRSLSPQTLETFEAIIDEL